MAAVNHFYVLNIGMNINPNFNVIYLFNNLQLRNTLYDHDILAFIIPTLLSLVQIIYPAYQDLFRTHPMAMSVVRSSLLAYCLAFSLWVLSIRHYARRQNLAYAHFWCPMAMRLSVAAAAGLAPETGDHHMPTFAAIREDSQYWAPLYH
ncbi:unnamed protein product [Prunus armeniaca]